MNDGELTTAKPTVVTKVLTRRPVTTLSAPPALRLPRVPLAPSDSSDPPAPDAAPRARRARRASLAPVAWGIVAALVVWCGALAYAATRAPTYESVAVVSFAPRDPVATGAETMILVAPKYVELLDSPVVVDRAAAQLGVEPEDVRARATGLIEPNTLNLRIEVRDDDAPAAAAAARVLAAGVVQAAAGDPLVSAELVAPATTDPVPMAPTPSQLRLFGLALGAGVGGLLALSLARRRPGWHRLWEAAGQAGPPGHEATSHQSRSHRRQPDTDSSRRVAHA